MTSPTGNENARYRVDVDADELEMRWSRKGKDLPTEIIGLSMDGVEFLMARTGGEAPKVGMQAIYSFRDKLLGKKLAVPGEVVHARREDDIWHVDAVFTEQDSLAEQLGESTVWRHFNRRRHFRVHPRFSRLKRSTVELRWGGVSQDYLLHDISAQGLAIRLSKHEQLEVPEGRPIRARLTLPHSDEVVEFVLRKLHDEVQSTHRRIGFELDAHRTAFAPSVEDKLIAAVMEWQRIAIQAKSRSEASPGPSDPKRRIA